MYLKCRKPQQAFKIWQEAHNNHLIIMDTALLQVAQLSNFNKTNITQAAISTCSDCVAGAGVKQIHSIYKSSGLDSGMIIFI